jgi:acyl dehydratase
MSEIRSRTVEGLKQGDSFATERTFTEEDVNRFAAISRDYNPIHFDLRFTETKGYTGRICHGLLVAGLLTEIGGQIGWLASGMNLRFKHPVHFGDTVQCRVTLDEVDEKGRATATCLFTNQEGVVVLEAELNGFLPGPAERKVMAAMVAEGDPTNPLR